MPVTNKVLGIENGSISGNVAMEPSSSGLFFFPQKDGSRAYFVLSKDLNQTEDDINAATGIPQFGELINGVPVRRLKAKELERIARHPTAGVPCALWTVTVETDSRFDATNQSDAEDPTDIRPKRRWYTQKEKELVETAQDGVLIATACGEPIIYERPSVRIYLEIQRYETYPTNPTSIYNYANHCNDATFYGAPIGCVLLDDIQSDEEVIDGTTYIKTVYVFKFLIRDIEGVIQERTLSETWLNHQGYLYFKTAGDTVPQTYLVDGHPTKVNLDEDGLILANGDDPVYVTFPDLPLADFDALNLEF